MANELFKYSITSFLLLIFAPDVFFSVQHSSEVLHHSPANLQGANRGFLLVLFMNTVIGNISVSSFISIILPYAAKRDQTEESMAPLKAHFRR